YLHVRFAMSSGTQARTIPPRASAVQQRTTSDGRGLGRVQRPLVDDEYNDEYDDDYSAQLPTSARRYDRYLAVPPPVVEPLPQRSRGRAFLYVLLVLLCIFIGVSLAVIIPPAWQNWRDSSTYGYPRTYQVNALV